MEWPKRPRPPTHPQHTCAPQQLERNSTHTRIHAYPRAPESCASISTRKHGFTRVTRARTRVRTHTSRQRLKEQAVLHSPCVQTGMVARHSCSAATATAMARTAVAIWKY